MCLPPCTWKIGVTVSLETLLIQKTDLNLHNNLTLVYYAFLDKLPGLTLPSPNIIFCLQMKMVFKVKMIFKVNEYQVKMVFKVVASAILVSYPVFLGLSHVYKKYTCY